MIGVTRAAAAVVRSRPPAAASASVGGGWGAQGGRRRGDRESGGRATTPTAQAHCCYSARIAGIGNRPQLKHQQQQRRGMMVSRGARGWGWYHKFMEGGQEAFRKATPPAPFDWDHSDGAQALQQWGRDPASRKRAWLELSVDGVSRGKVEVELASDVLPLTCDNFLKLCTGDNPTRLHYAGAPVHQLVKNTGLLVGDVEGGEGKKSHSALGKRYFRDEAFLIPHTDGGLLSMANSGRDSNGSQFYVTTEAAPQLDGRCVAFGRVVRGMEVVRGIMNVFHIRGAPATPVRIQACGEGAQ